MRFFDSHAHLTDDSFESDLADVLSRAAAQGISSIVSIASNLDDTRAAITLAKPVGPVRVRATAGIHPHEADRWTAQSLADLEVLAAADAVVAIGETGLDFHYDNTPRDRQIEAFRGQLELAERLELPVVVHSRDADDPMAALVREFAGRVSGVLHCFSGGESLLQAGLDADWYVSFAGIVTFKSFRDSRYVQRVPDDRLLIETDSPYLAPVPMRGRRNEPAHVSHVARRIAEIRGQALDQLAEQTYRNACHFYGLDN